MRLILLFFTFSYTLLGLSAYAQDETLTDSVLNEITVVGFSKGESVLKQSATITFLQPKDYEVFSPANPVMAWNTMPGVNLEQRAIGSYRINIRGSSLRSPFGVRDVKVYWNGIPFTEANGSTALNTLSMHQMKRVEVIKGPSGSLYGAGLGGVVHLSNFPEQEKSPLTVQLTAGSFERLQLAASGQFNHNKAKTYYSFNHNQTLGYRDHNALNRQVYQLSHQQRINDNNQLELHALFSDLYYEIPGGLTQEQFDENPRQARARSAEQNASIDQQTILLGTNYLGFINEKLSHSTNVGLTLTVFENPFILDYKEETNREIALRHQWTYQHYTGTLEWQWDAGFEYQYANNEANNYGNVTGEKDTVRFKDQLNIDRKTFFAQLQLSKGAWNATLGLSSNLSTYEVDRNENAFAAPFTFRRNFDNELIPRFALQYEWTEKQSTFASVSEGFSSPTLDEIRTNEGSINRNLQAEQGITYELGHKLYQQNWQLDASVFYSQLDESITTFTDANGVGLFRNSGGTTQYGLELGVSARLYQSSTFFVKRLTARTAYQYYQFNFRDYQKRENDFSGNSLPGVPNHSFNQLLNLKLANRFNLNIHYRYVSETPLNDANNIYAEEFHLINMKLSKSFTVSGLAFNAFIGAENLLDYRYSLGNDLNAFGGRFFQPAPGRNFYAGIRFRF